jgi:hypothetical protein
MTTPLPVRQDHVLYATWTGLVVVAVTLGLAHQIGASSRYAMYLARMGGAVGSDLTALLVACAAYLLFRLVRPFAFATAEGQAPAGALYHLGTFIVTVATGASVTYLAWAVLHPAVLAHFRSAGLVLSLALLAGFLVVEASLVRAEASSGGGGLYVDGGLVSALIVVSGCLAWFINVSPRSGLGRLVAQAFSAQGSALAPPLAVGGAVFVLWLLSRGLRRRWSESPLYGAAVAALWVFGIAAYVFAAILPHRAISMSSRMTAFEYFWSGWYARPAASLVALVVVWLIVTIAGYLVLRHRRAS